MLITILFTYLKIILLKYCIQTTLALKIKWSTKVALVVDLGRTPKLFILLQLRTFYPKEYYQKNGGHPSEPKFSPRCFGL